MLACMIMSWTAPGMQHFVAIGLGVSAPQMRDFAVPFDVTSFSLRFIWFFNKTTAYTLNGFLHKIRQTTSFRVRKCLFGNLMTILNI